MPDRPVGGWQKKRRGASRASKLALAGSMTTGTRYKLSPIFWPSRPDRTAARPVSDLGSRASLYGEHVPPRFRRAA